MSNEIRSLMERRQPIEEASEWVARLDRGLAVDEQQALRAWVAADDRNRDALIEVVSLWDRMDALAQLSELFPAPTLRRRPRRWVYGLAFAASLVLAVLVVLSLTGRGGLPDGGLATTLVYETAVGGLSTATLSDGSLLTLNTASRVRVDFDKHRRDIVLDQGEIHIEVTPDPQRPLRVIAGSHIVEAVGTAFSVNLNESRSLEVLVAEGRVRISLSAPDDVSDSSGNVAQRQPIYVVEGEHLVLDERMEAPEQLPPDDIDVRLSWRNGNLIFRGETLADAAMEVGRYTSVEFRFEGEHLKETRVAGLFKAGDVSGFLASLRANFAIDHERTDENTIVLRARQ